MPALRLPVSERGILRRVREKATQISTLRYKIDWSLGNLERTSVTDIIALIYTLP